MATTTTTTIISVTTLSRPRLDLTRFQINRSNLITTRRPMLSLSSTPTKSFKINCNTSPHSYPPSTPPTTGAVAAPVVEEVYSVVNGAASATTTDEKFDWYAEWYPVSPVCDLDKAVPHGTVIMGMNLVVWWDRNEEQWKVFEDSCPHRLAPLSEGRIDKWGRLQCVYHGWCFNGSGSCKLIPQAPIDATPVHTSKKACVASYPCTVQHDILWFWPNSDPKYRDIATKKQPPYIPELDDPNYTRSMGIRDFPYGYEVLVENIMDPAHVHYAHYGLMPPMPVDKTRPNADREGGRPLDFSVEKIEKNGFSGKQPGGYNKFMPPCVFYMAPDKFASSEETTASVSEKDGEKEQQRRLLIFICIPVSPGKSRALWIFPRNFMQWLDNIIPRWAFHVLHNLVLDSDLNLLHVEERRLLERGGKWQKGYYMPTKSDTMVVSFRKWLDKYAGESVDWGTLTPTPTQLPLPATPNRAMLFDRYWTHVVKCTSCSKAYKWLKIAKTMGQILSIGLVGVVGLVEKRKSVVFVSAIVCFVVSKLLGGFIEKHFHFHDYNHAHV